MVKKSKIPAKYCIDRFEASTNQMNLFENKSTSNCRNKYDDAFKRDIVRKLMESGKSVSEFAVYLGVKRINLQKWKQKYGPEFENRQRNGKPELLKTQIKKISSDLAELQETVNHLRNIVKHSLTAKYSDKEWQIDH